MARAQTGFEQLLAQSRQQIESTIFEEQFILHPHCESRMSLLCTFKIITKSRCFNGSGALRRPRPVRGAEYCNVTCTCGAIGGRNKCRERAGCGVSVQESRRIGVQTFRHDWRKTEQVFATESAGMSGKPGDGGLEI